MRAKRGAAVSAVLAALLVAGCATAPASKTSAAKPEDPALARALQLTEAASQASLAESAGLLASSMIVDTGKAARIASMARFLYAKLYPELDSPFGKGSAAPPDGEVGDFFRALAPALSLLDPASAADAPLLDALSAADALNPASVLTPYLRGMYLERNGAGAGEALAAYETCLQRAPSFYPAGIRISEILISENKASSELPRLEQLASLLPTAQMRYIALARAELAGGQPEKAADAAARGLLVAPEDSRFAVLRAEAYDAMGNWYQALWLLDTLLKLKPDEPDALLMKARILSDKEHNDGEAVSVLLDAEARFPRDPAFPELRGRILMSAGKPEEALSALTGALSLSPGSLSTLTLLVRLATNGQDWEKASSWLAQIPDASLTGELIVQGWEAATGLGDHTKAIAYAQTLERKTGGPAPLALEARSMVSAGQPEKARVVIDHALGAMEPEPALRAELYAIRSTAASEDPQRDLRSALMEDADNVDALVGMSDHLGSQKEYRKALGYAKRAAELSPDNAAIAQRVADLQDRAETGE
jgi:tetratricopeptide (TPR) repeat protein